jgi:tetratricopeptide (TPR) repeat protein
MRLEVKSHAWPVLLLGLVLSGPVGAQEDLLREAERLDSEQKCDEAEQYYRRAMQAGSPSPALLNNLGNHYLACEAPDQARVAFENLLKINPRHVNGNLQLAKLAVSRKDGAAALTFLGHLAIKDPEVELVRAEALAQTGKREAAAGIIDGLMKTTIRDPHLQFAIGLTCGRLGLYLQAESAFTAVLARYPNEYDVLYNLGLAAARNGHNERARHAFAVTLKVRPGDVDSLYESGRVESNLQNYNRAVYFLAQARKLAPQRPEVMLALARAAQMAGYYGDALLAYDDYLKLRPDDDLVRRDWALLYGYSRGGLEEGLKVLADYAQSHPGDAVGFYNLAQLTDRADREKAIELVSTSIRLSPEFGRARYYRGWLLQKVGRDQEALGDLQAALRLNPRDTRAMDLLGLSYLDLERPAEAENALRSAIALSPDDPEILFHLGRSLIELGRAKEAQPFLDRFKKAKQAEVRGPREEAGIIESATLTAAERSRRVLAQLRQAVRAKPEDYSARIGLGSALLADGNSEEAVRTLRELLAMDPGGVVLHQAGLALLRFDQCREARPLLERAVAEVTAARLDLAIAVLCTDGPQAGLAALDQLEEGRSSGDYLLTRARMLEAAGKIAEADQILSGSAHYSVSRPQLAREVALLLVRHKQSQRALELVDDAMKSAPGDAGLNLTRVVVLSSLGRNGDAGKVVKEIESRWPEWDRPYLIEGLLLERESRPVDAKKRIQIALALGNEDTAVKCALARMAHAEIGECSCQPGIYEFFFQPCGR